jgi:hypothetical protein
VDRASRRSPSRAESGFAVVLAVFAVIAAAAAIPIVWTRLTVLDTGRFAQVAGPLGNDPAVQASLALLVADDTIEALSAKLPATGIDEGAARLVIQQGVRTVMGGSAFERFWSTATTDVHDQIIDAMRGDGPDRVSFNYLPLVVVAVNDAGDSIRGLLGADVSVPDIPTDASLEHARRLLQRGLGIDLPADFGTIVIYDGGRLHTFARAVGWVDRLAIVLPILAVVLAAGAMVIGRRPARTLGGIAVAVAVVAGFEVLTSRLVRDVALTGVSGEGRAVAETVVDAFRSSYVGVVQTVGLGALAVAVAAVIAGTAARFRSRRSA